MKQLGVSASAVFFSVQVNPMDLHRNEDFRWGSFTSIGNNQWQNYHNSPLKELGSYGELCKTDAYSTGSGDSLVVCLELQNITVASKLKSTHRVLEPNEFCLPIPIFLGTFLDFQSISFILNAYNLRCLQLHAVYVQTCNRNIRLAPYQPGKVPKETA